MDGEGMSRAQNRFLYDMRGEGISVVAVTKRENDIPNIIANYDRQFFGLKELIIILNNDRIIEENIKERYRERLDIRIYQLPEFINLGICLNYGYERTYYKYIVKFDDDDYYSMYYLQEVYDAFKQTGCDIVCKSNIFYYLQGYGELLLIPSLLKVGKPVKNGAGATISMTREAFNHIQYGNLKKGVDLDLFSRNKKIGLDIYSTTSYNFLCIRKANVQEHTWQISEESLEAKADKKYGIKKISLEKAYEEVTYYAY